MKNTVKYNIRKDYKLLVEITSNISDPPIKKWALTYLNGHLDHYAHVVSKVLSLSINNKIIRILEIGAVPGHISTILKKLNYEIDIVDINPDRAKEVFQSSEIFTYKVDIEKEALPIGNKQYDLILMNEVLEHLRYEPLKIFFEVKRVLKDGGFFFISTPNITPLMRIRFLFGKDYIDDILNEFEKITKIGHMGHYRIFSIVEVVKILKHFCFEPINISYGGNLHREGNIFINKLFIFLFGKKMKKQVHIIARNN